MDLFVLGKFKDDNWLVCELMRNKAKVAGNLAKEWSFYSGRNGMIPPFLQEWNDFIPFQSEWNDHPIPAGMKCPSTPNLLKYMDSFHSIPA